MTQLSGALQANAEALRATELRYRTVFQTSPEAVMISRMDDGAIIDVNQAFFDVTGYDREAVMGRTTVQLQLWSEERDRLKFLRQLNRSSACRDLELRFRRKNGEVFWARLSASVLEIDGAACVLSFSRDISDSKLAEEKILDLAFYDPLTGLANRRLLFERLTHSLVTPC